MKSSKKIALSGVFVALCVVFLFIGSVFQVLDLCAAMLGSFVVLAAIIELGKGYAFGIYLASGALSILLLPYKTPAFVFALFCGFYPILKVFLNKITPKPLSILARVGVFSTSLFAMYFTLGEALGFDALGGWPVIAAFIFAVFMFLLYDISLERASWYYIKRIKPKLFKR